MIRVGLTGGIATGKSTVSHLFVECGAFLIDADELAREAVAPGEMSLCAIVAAFGPGMLNADGTLNRQRLGELIFSNREQRHRLEAIIHPYVFAEEERRSQLIAAQDPHAVVLFDAALLIETRSHETMDRVIIVAAGAATQRQRLMSRNHLTKDQALQRIGAQMPLAEKIKMADYVVDGTLPINQLKDRVEQIYRELKGLADVRNRI